jgi:ubiquinone biosynthesis O-methyltransferase
MSALGSARRRAKLLAYRAAQATGLLPSIWMMRNPFKIYEFNRLIAGAGLADGQAVLDVGCGKGFQTQVLARTCASAVGIDTSTVQIEGAREFLAHSPVERKVRFLCARIQDAALADASFDRVFSFSVLEHIPEFEEVLTEIVRVLKPGGELHVSVDALATIAAADAVERHRTEHHVVQYFTPQTLARQLGQAGLELIEIFPIMTGPFASAAFERRIWSSDFTHGPLARLRFYRQLVADDATAGSDSGVMLVARARKPSAQRTSHAA